MPTTVADANLLLQELECIHRDSIFPTVFERIQFHMVASFECEIARKNGVITLDSTTFWMSADRNPAGMMRLVYDNDFATRAGSALNNESLTAACGETGNINIVIGFSPTEEQAVEAVERAAAVGANSLLAPVKPTTRSVRAARRKR